MTQVSDPGPSWPSCFLRDLKKKKVPDFRYRENIHCDRKVYPFSPLKLRHFFTHNISKNRYMKYNKRKYSFSSRDVLIVLCPHIYRLGAHKFCPVCLRKPLTLPITFEW